MHLTMKERIKHVLETLESLKADVSYLSTLKNQPENNVVGKNDEETLKNRSTQNIQGSMASLPSNPEEHNADEEEDEEEVATYATARPFLYKHRPKRR